MFVLLNVDPFTWHVFAVSLSMYISNYFVIIIRIRKTVFV